MKNLTRTDLLQIDGQQLPTPTDSPTIQLQTIDSSDSGQDEGGYYHREVLRSGVLSCSLKYSYLSNSDAAYLLQLLSAPTFSFTCPLPGTGQDPQTVTRTCYCKNLPALSYMRTLMGQSTWKDVSFDIQEL